MDELVGRLSDPADGPSGQVVLTLSITGGWGLPDHDELRLSIEDDGRVVRLTDTSVFSSTQDYSRLQLSTKGVIRVLGLVRPVVSIPRDDLDGGAGVSPTERSAWLEVGETITVGMDRIGRTDGYDAGQVAQRARFLRAIDRIRDLAWLGSDIIEPEAPWTPDAMTVLAAPIGQASAAGSVTAFSPWPLERPIEELASGTQLDPAGQERLVVCLGGEDVAPVFALLTGVNHAHLGVDDGQRWELNVRPHTPGYRLVGDPCE